MPTASVAIYRIESDDATGNFVGFGSLLDPAVVFLHPSASAAVRSGPSGLRLRCQITSNVQRTLDGTLLDTPTGVAHVPRAVGLDGTFSGDSDEVTVPQGPGHPTAEEAADAVARFVASAALSDPRDPDQKPPSTADKGGPAPEPSKRPWYCVICPGALGC